MEFLLIAGIAYAVIALDLIAKRQPGAPPGSTPPGSAPPGVMPPAPAVPPKPWGLYPPGTPGTLPIQVTLIGGDGFAQIAVIPGEVVGPSPGASKTFWYGPGTPVIFAASLLPSFPPPLFTAFDHWEGPGGLRSKQNPFFAPITSSGWIRGVFAFLGQPGW